MQEELIEKAKHALALEESSPEAEEIYLSLIRSLSEQYGNNQKEIANALKTMASQLESEQGAPQAFQFKQRTCEMLLRHTIEQRHAGQANYTAGNGQTKHRPVQSAYPAEQTAKADISDLPTEIVDKANAAAQTSDPEDSERLFTELIVALENLHNRNEREIAATLQRLSRSLTDENRAFHFKQKTCEVLLKLSMARRRNARQ